MIHVRGVKVTKRENDESENAALLLLMECNNQQPINKSFKRISHWYLPMCLSIKNRAKTSFLQRTHSLSRNLEAHSPFYFLYKLEQFHSNHVHHLKHKLKRFRELKKQKGFLDYIVFVRVSDSFFFFIYKYNELSAEEKKCLPW